MAMSGDATEAYVFLLHAINTCNLLDGNRSGRTDLGYLANRLRDAYMDLREHVEDLPGGQVVPDVPNLDVALYGWSWRHLAFEGYTFSYDKHGGLVRHPLDDLAPNRPYPLHLMGDAAKEARRRINDLRQARDRPVPRRGDPDAPSVAADAFLDWEPLEVLLDMTGDSSVRSVGGVPQVSRIYQYGEVEQFVWRTEAGVDYFGGRPVQPAERFDRRILQLVDGVPSTCFSDQSIYSTSHASVPLDANDDVALAEDGAGK
jgi:hypothetical protein